MDDFRTNAARELAAYLVENIGCRFTATKMLKPLGVASASTVSQWCDWIEKAYLFFFDRKPHNYNMRIFSACDDFREVL